MHFLEIDNIIMLHQDLIKNFGGSTDLRDRNLLDSALTYPQFLFSIAMEKDIYLLAGAYCYHLISNHPFIDGNKRIRVLAMLTFLKINNVHVKFKKDKLYNLAMDIAMSKLTEDAVSEILKSIIINDTHTN